jgi:hypothetical protein
MVCSGREPGRCHERDSPTQDAARARSSDGARPRGRRRDRIPPVGGSRLFGHELGRPRGCHRDQQPYAHPALLGEVGDRLGVAPATARLRETLSRTDDSTPLSDAVRRAIVDSVSHDPRVQRASTDWLRLIAGEPELSAMAFTAYQSWITELAGYIGRRAPEMPDAVARALATAYQTASFVALTEWAGDGAHGRPADAVDATLRWMDVASGSPEP